MLLRNDIDHTRDGIRAIEGTRSTLHDLNLLDVLGINQRQIVLSAHIAMDALTIDQYQYIVISQTVELHLRTHIVLAEGERCRQACKDILQTAPSIILQHAMGDDLCLHRGILQEVLSSCTRHHYLL